MTTRRDFLRDTSMAVVTTAALLLTPRKAPPADFAHTIYWTNGTPTMCYRLPTDRAWRVRTTPPNNPALTGGAARRTTPPVLRAGLSGYLRDTSATGDK